MSASSIATLTDSLEGLGVGVTRTDPDGFSETIANVVRPPAVGVPLGFADVSLVETPVTVDPTVGDLEAATTGVTRASMGVASYGSLVLEATPEGAEEVSLFPELHVAVLRESDVVDGMADAFEQLGPKMRSERASAIVATGPSATADMGGLVYGAHGPGEVHVVLLGEDDR